MKPHTPIHSITYVCFSYIIQLLLPNDISTELILHAKEIKLLRSKTVKQSKQRICNKSRQIKQTANVPSTRTQHNNFDNN